ncbi:MAG: hypothetical protein WD271_14900 [Acidimicrobiia bacterium]
MLRPFVVATTALALTAAVPAGAVDPGAAVPPDAYLTAGTYARTPFVAFTARDAQPLYTDALKGSCPRAAEVDAALAKGPSSGNGVLLGTSDGRIVVNERIHVFPNAKAARNFVTTARSSAACLGYGARDAINSVFVQYAQLPPPPTFASAVSNDDGVWATTFESTSAAAPLAGAAALLTWDNLVAEATARVANAKPGELEELERQAWASLRYRLLAWKFEASNPKLAKDADEGAKRFIEWAPTANPFVFQPSPRSVVPANPAACRAATDAFLSSGTNGVIRGFRAQDPATRTTVGAEIIVFPTKGTAGHWFGDYSNLGTCLHDLYLASLPAGSSVDVERVPKRGSATIGAKKLGVRDVFYISTLNGPDGLQIGTTAIAALTAGSRGAFTFMQLPVGVTLPLGDTPSANLETMAGGLATVLGP